MRLRRSVSIETYDPITHATVIDSIGNARSERSLERLTDHVIRSHNNEPGSHDLTIRHAAVNAIRVLESEEVSQIIWISVPICTSLPNP